jgi:hypothetical protein
VQPDGDRAEQPDLAGGGIEADRGDRDAAGMEIACDAEVVELCRWQLLGVVRIGGRIDDRRLMRNSVGVECSAETISSRLPVGAGSATGMLIASCIGAPAAAALVSAAPFTLGASSPDGRCVTSTIGVTSTTSSRESERTIRTPSADCAERSAGARRSALAATILSPNL